MYSLVVGVSVIASQTVGFAISDEDRERLDKLVDYFGGGNRWAYLPATLKVMESLRHDAAEFPLWLSPHILDNTTRVLMTVVGPPKEEADDYKDIPCRDR
jgi:hypothetical protein